MTEEKTLDLLPLVGDITSSYVANNSVPAGEVATLIVSIHAALSGLGTSADVAPAEKPQGAVSARKSLADPNFIVSMIDGKKYSSLTRHLNTQGLDPKTYRERFGLPADYPMVAANYSEKRRAIAKALGLGRKANVAAAPAPALEAAKPRRGRKPKVAA